MSGQPHEYPPADPLPGKSLRAIRAALVAPQDLKAFDSGLDVALREVRTTLDLSKLTEFIHMWWLIACDSVKDPVGRARMHEQAARIQELAARGEPLPRGDKSWQELLADRGVEL